ncbi:MAG: homoserine kinase [Alphaproteobacteria bacterium]|nr:homoserine kinase [Alphaproteobacteria bacterium]
MAVYTHISEEDLKQYLTLFDIGELVSFEGIADGVENTNYKLVTTQSMYVLTLFEKRTKAEDLPFCINFIEYLRSKGIPCPTIIKSRSGEKTVPFQGKPAIIATFLEGDWPQHIEEFHATNIGSTLARMHLAGEKFEMHQNNGISLPVWKKLIASCGDKADSIEPGLFLFLQKELEYLEKNQPHDIPSGAIHTDLFPDNVLFTGQKLTGVLDFSFSCTEAFVYDLMMTLNSWCFTSTGMQDTKKSAALLNAYQKERPLTTQELEALPYFGRAAALRIVSTRLYDMLYPVEGIIVKAKDPLEYVRILKFHQMRNRIA